MGKLYKRGGYYWADYRTPEGERVRVSLRTKDPKAAKLRLRAAEMGSSGGPTYAPKFLGDAIDNMIDTKRATTQGIYQKKSLHLLRVFGGDLDINKLTRAMVVDYTTLRTKEKAKRHTVHKELVVLRQTLKEARKRDEYGGSIDVVPNWSSDYEPRTRWLTPDEFTALVTAAKPERRNWLVLQVYTSANMGEVSKLTWDHVDFVNGFVRVPGTKRTSRFRRVPIHPALRTWLMAADASRPLVKPWSKANWWLRETTRKLGIPHVSTNDLRRTFASWLKQAGVDSLSVAHMMGHSSPAMVNRVYGQLAEATYVSAIDRMPSASLPNMDTPASRSLPAPSDPTET